MLLELRPRLPSDLNPFFMIGYISEGALTLEIRIVFLLAVFKDHQLGKSKRNRTHEIHSCLVKGVERAHISGSCPGPCLVPVVIDVALDKSPTPRRVFEKGMERQKENLPPTQFSVKPKCSPQSKK